MFFKKFLLTLIFALVLATGFSIASAQISLTPPCTLEPLPAQSFVGQTTVCPYCANYSPLPHFKWDLKGEFADPVCNLECWGPSGDACANWPTGHFFKDHRGFEPKTEPLKPKDDVYIKNPYPNATATGSGTNLKLTCYDRKDTSKTKSSAGIRVVSDCSAPAVGEPCEVPFNPKIIDSINNGDIPHITEVNPSGWSYQDALDTFGGEYKSQSGFGSGDGYDLMRMVSNNQECITDWNPGNSPFGSTTLEMLRFSLNKGDPLQVNIYGNMHNYSGIDEASTTGHGLIAYALTESAGRIRIDVVDPNLPHLKYLDNCVEQEILSGPRILTCHNFPFGVAYMDPYYVVTVSRQTGNFTSQTFTDYLKTKHNIFCNQPGNRGKNLCVGTATSRLLNGWMLQFDNPLTIKNEGSCFSWAKLQLYLLYAVDFVGYDYHPNDGKVVCDGSNSGNCACDTNHYPIPAKSKTTLANPTSWLANIWSAWYNIFN